MTHTHTQKLVAEKKHESNHFDFVDKNMFGKSRHLTEKR